MNTISEETAKRIILAIKADITRITKIAQRYRLAENEKAIKETMRGFRHPSSTLIEFFFPRKPSRSEAIKFLEGKRPKLVPREYFFSIHDYYKSIREIEEYMVALKSRQDQINLLRVKIDEWRNHRIPITVRDKTYSYIA